MYINDALPLSDVFLSDKNAPQSMISHLNPPQSLSHFPWTLPLSIVWETFLLPRSAHKTSSHHLKFNLAQSFQYNLLCPILPVHSNLYKCLLEDSSKRMNSGKYFIKCLNRDHKSKNKNQYFPVLIMATILTTFNASLIHLILVTIQQSRLYGYLTHAFSYPPSLQLNTLSQTLCASKKISCPVVQRRDTSPK